MQVNIRDSYHKYYKKQDNKNPVDSKTYITIVLGFILFIVKKIMEGEDVKLPGRLGTLGIRGKKTKPFIGNDGEVKGLAPNWPETKKLWDSNPEAKEKKQIIYCFNEHSDGITYKITWFTERVTTKNKEFYQFRFSRQNKRTLNKLIKEGKEYFITPKKEAYVRHKKHE